MRHLSITVLLLFLVAMFPIASVSATAMSSDAQALTGRPLLRDAGSQQAVQPQAPIAPQANLHKVSVHSGAIIDGKLGTVHSTATKVVLDLPYRDSRSKSDLDQMGLLREKRNQ